MSLLGKTCALVASRSLAAIIGILLIAIVAQSADSLQLSPVHIAGKWGYINHEGKVVVEPQFDFAYNFREGLARVVIGGRIGYIDQRGMMVIPLVFWGHRDFSEGLAAVYILDEAILLDRCNSLRSQEGYIDKVGRVVICDARFNSLGSFSEGLADVAVGVGQDYRGRGYIDHAGKIVIQPRFFGTEEFSEDRAAVMLDPGGNLFTRVHTAARRSWRVIDKSGKFIGGSFDAVGSYSEGLAYVRKDGKMGYIDHNGKVVVSFQFNGAGSFLNGLAEVKLQQKCGFIDRTGKWVREFDCSKSTINH